MLDTKYLFRNLLLATALILPFTASADPIVIEVIEGGDTPEALRGYVMMPFDEPAIPEGGCTTSTENLFRARWILRTGTAIHFACPFGIPTGGNGTTAMYSPRVTLG